MNIRPIFVSVFLAFVALSSAIAQPRNPASHECATAVPDSLFHGVELPVGGDSTLCVKVTNCGDSLENFVADIAGVGYDVDQTFSGPIKPDSFFTYCITFHPQDYGVPNTTLNIRIAGTGQRLVIPLLGFTPCAKLTALPDTLKFPVMAVGSTDSMAVAIKNSGDLSWSPGLPLITSATGAFTILSFDTSSIPPPKSKIVTVKFSPTVTAKDSATITFPDAGPCGNAPAVRLYGEGGCAVLTNDVPAIPNTGVGEKRIFTFTITNTGTLSWYPGSEVITGTGASCFKLISVVPVPLPPNGSATFAMEFSPGATGQCCAQLSFPNGGPCGYLQAIDLCGFGIASGVKEISSSSGFTLDQNFPNPFTKTTSFNYTTPKETEVIISLNDLNGNVVRTLTRGIVSEGNHLVSFDASNLPSGTYFYMLRSGSTKLTRELVLTK